MYAFKNTFEGGVNGVALTQGAGGNTGGASGDYFTFIVNGAGGNIQFGAMPWGGMGAIITNGTAATYPRWDDNANLDTRVVVRRPVWLDAELGAGTNLAIIYAGASAMGGLVLAGPGAHVRKVALAAGSGMVYNAGSQSAAALALDHLYWVELAARSSSDPAGPGLEYRVLDSDGVTQIATFDLGIATNASPPTRVRFGANTSTAIALDYLKDVRFESKTSGWLGPLAAAPPTLSVSHAERYVIDARASSVGVGSIEYSILQASGPPSAPAAITAGLWHITPHATETLSYEVTADGSLGGSASTVIEVPPLGSGSGGVSSPVTRLRKVGSSWE